MLPPPTSEAGRGFLAGPLDGLGGVEGEEGREDGVADHRDGARVVGHAVVPHDEVGGAEVGDGPQGGGVALIVDAVAGHMAQHVVVAGGADAVEGQGLEVGGEEGVLRHQDGARVVGDPVAPVGEG